MPFESGECLVEKESGTLGQGLERRIMRMRTFEDDGLVRACRGIDPPARSCIPRHFRPYEAIFDGALQERHQFAAPKFVKICEKRAQAAFLFVCGSIAIDIAPPGCMEFE